MWKAEAASRSSVGSRGRSLPSCCIQRLSMTTAPEAGAVTSNRRPSHDAVLAPSPACVPPLAPVQHAEAPAARRSQNGILQHSSGAGECQAHSAARLWLELSPLPASIRDGNSSNIPLRPWQEDWKALPSRERERERKIKVRVNALQINVTEVYWEMRALHSKSCQLSKWNYPLQWLDYYFKRPVWNYLNFYENCLKKARALLMLL